MLHGLPTKTQAPAIPLDRPDEGDAAEKLRVLIERIERLTDSRLRLAAEIRKTYQEAWNSGFSVRLLRKVVWLRQRAARRFDATGSVPKAAPRQRQ